jgi:hypothetical protein
MYWHAVEKATGGDVEVGDERAAVHLGADANGVGGEPKARKEDRRRHAFELLGRHWRRRRAQV